MFSSKNLVHDVKDIPQTWIFEHFCKLKEKLIGQDIKIKSFFTEEKTPSLCIYLNKDKNEYRFKDFSSGKSGSAIDLVKELTNLSFHKTATMIVEHYNDYVLHNNGGYDVQEFKKASKYKVSSYKFRSWSTQDQYFWTQSNIGTRLLDEHFVRPFESYTLEKEEDGKIKSLDITGNYLYGYFTKEGVLYKIYQPKTLDKKFIKVENYIQGSEQLKNHKHLIITSSLKDIMALKSLKLAIDIIAPDSENTFLSKALMKIYQDKYLKIIILFDNDEAGIKAMIKYKELYPFVEIAVLPLSKDPSDSIKDFGVKKTLLTLVPILDRKINNV